MSAFERHAAVIAPTPTTAIGVLAPARPDSGLLRDAETICWSLRGQRDLKPSILLVQGNLYTTDYAKSPTAPYTIRYPTSLVPQAQTADFGTWLSGLDILFILEAYNPTLVRAALASPKLRRIFYIPNLEWAVLNPYGDNTAEWISLLQAADQRIVCLARSQSISQGLTNVGIASTLIPWSVPDPVRTRCRKAEGIGRRLRVLYNAGNHGFRDRRGSDVVASALQQWPDCGPKLYIHIKSNQPHPALAVLPNKPSLQYAVDIGYQPDRHSLIQLYDEADVVVYPSRFEGFGLGLLEALHRGCYVLATDGTPMTDLLPPEALRITASAAGRVRLAPRYEPQPHSLVSNLLHLCHRPEQLRCDHSDKYRRRQDAFIAQMVGLVCSV